MIARLAKSKKFAPLILAPAVVEEFATVEPEIPMDKTPSANTDTTQAEVPPADIEANVTVQPTVNEQAEAGAAPKKKKKPPLITVATTNHSGSQQEFNNKGLSCELRLVRDTIKVYTASEEDHATAEEILTYLNCEYITHPFKTGPKIKMLLKGVPLTVPTKVILNKLQADGLKPFEVRPVPTGNGFNIFAVDFPRGNTTLEDLQASHRGFAGYRGSWALAPYKNMKNAMCRKCCGFGHLEKGCHVRRKCYACAEEHWDCDKLAAASAGLAPPSTSSNPNPEWTWRCINCFRRSTEDHPIDFNHMAIDSDCLFRLVNKERMKMEAASRLAAKNQKIQEKKDKAVLAALASKAEWPVLRQALAALPTANTSGPSVHRQEPLREPAAARSTLATLEAQHQQPNHWGNAAIRRPNFNSGTTPHGAAASLLP